MKFQINGDISGYNFGVIRPSLHYMLKRAYYGLITYHKVGRIIVDKARPVMKLASFVVICFCSQSFLFVRLDRAQNTKDIEMQMNN